MDNQLVVPSVTALVLRDKDDVVIIPKGKKKTPRDPTEIWVKFQDMGPPESSGMQKGKKKKTVVEKMEEEQEVMHPPKRRIHTYIYTPTQ